MGRIKAGLTYSEELLSLMPTGTVEERSFVGGSGAPNRCIGDPKTQSSAEAMDPNSVRSANSLGRCFDGRESANADGTKRTRPKRHAGKEVNLNMGFIDLSVGL